MNKHLIVFLLVAIVAAATSAQILEKIVEDLLEPDPDAVEDADLDFIGLANKYGYEATAHTITTEDARQLTVFRMRARNIKIKPRPVLVGHGVLQSSDAYITTGPKYCLGFYIADSGYDLWFLNFRSNRYSRNPSVPDEFNFSFHELGIYDLPAIVDYVLKATNTRKLDYIGYSQGTTAAYVMLSKRDEYNDKINLNIDLAPIAWMFAITSPQMRATSVFIPFGQAYLNKTGQKEILPYGSPEQKQTEAFCKLSPSVAALCSAPIMSAAGYDPTQLPYERVAAIQGHEPAGTSSKVMIHFGQLVLKDKFSEYDYGSPEANYDVYGSALPPDYDLSKITAKTVLIWGPNDWLSSKQSVRRLQKVLKNVLELYTVPYLGWSHLDFMIGKNVRKLVGDKILSYLAKYPQPMVLSQPKQSNKLKRS